MAIKWQTQPPSTKPCQIAWAKGMRLELYWLAGNASQAPAAGDSLDLQLGENWRRTGTVLAAVQLAEGVLWVQAVLNNDLDAESVLRVREEEGSKLTIQPLPYSLLE